MDQALRNSVERFVETNIGQFHSSRISALESLHLGKLLQNKNPYLFKAKNLCSAPDFVKGLLDARLSSSEEGIFGIFLEELALFVARETSGGQKSSAEGIDIELTKQGVRYLIAVKSGKNWGNSTQHARLRQNFSHAVRVMRQSRFVGEIQPTLGICYGRFKTANNGLFLHIGGQSFWHLLSDDPELYTGIIEPLGHEAKRSNDEFEEKKIAVYNRFTREFIEAYCDTSGAIEWFKLVEMVSKNLA